MGMRGKNEYTLTLRDMRGVDFSATTSERKRFRYLENMYKDYSGRGGSVIESAPGFRLLTTLAGEIHGIYTQRDASSEEYVIVHAGDKVYRFNTKDKDMIFSLAPIFDARDSKSIGFLLGNTFYLVDDGGIIRIDDSGATRRITSSEEDAYVPTTYLNALPFEQKNLLINKFKEKYVIGAAETVSYGTPDLLYGITNEEKGLCAVIGISQGFQGGEINIPAYTRIGGKLYKVYEIFDNAFLESRTVYSVKIAMGVYRVGKFAFKGCTALQSVFCPDSIGIIDTGAFSGCTSLHKLYLGLGLERLGAAVSDGCESLTSVSYASNKEDFESVENHELFDGILFEYFSADLSITVEIPVCTRTREILTVTLGGEEPPSYFPIWENGIIKSIIFPIDDRRTVEGKEVVISGVWEYDSDAESGSALGIFEKCGHAGDGFSAISACTVCEKFDGRIFLSGNAELGGTVFFSARETEKTDGKLYFGSYNFLSDGVGRYPITAMLALADSLAVFKKGDDGGGSIFYHTPKETGDDFIPKTYPIAYTHNGIGAIGGAISFFDDPIFISKNGVFALDKRTINLERSIAARSHNVNARLLCEDLTKATLTEWCGYLAIGINGQIFLADSRATFTHETGSREYEWFYFNHVGTYKKATRVYRYSHIAPAGYKVFPYPDEVASGTVFSDMGEDGFIYYVKNADDKICVYATEEMVGGEFHPLTYLKCIGDDLLLFGTDNGDLCIFNNDMRGIPPAQISISPDFNLEEYKVAYGSRLHPSFYGFHDHAMRCALVTASDNCGLGGLAKNTVKNSLTVKCDLSGAGRLRCEVETDKAGYSELCALPNEAPDFSNWNFSSLTLDSRDSVTIPIKEKEKGWVEKALAFYCDDFCSPIAIETVSYRFTVAGRIKYT